MYSLYSVKISFITFKNCFNVSYLLSNERFLLVFVGKYTKITQECLVYQNFFLYLPTESLKQL